MNSHADVSCIGKHARILELIQGQTCNVSPFNDSYKPITNVKTVNVAFAIDLPDGGTYILHINNALDFSDSMEHSILCTNQTRHKGLIVDDVSPIVDVTNTSTHSVYFPSHDVRLPLYMFGPVSHLRVQYPSDQDLTNCDHLHLTDAKSLCDPSFFNEENRIKSVFCDLGPIVHQIMQYDVLDKIVNSVRISFITKM